VVPNVLVDLLDKLCDSPVRTVNYTTVYDDKTIFMYRIPVF